MGLLRRHHLAPAIPALLCILSATTVISCSRLKLDRPITSSDSDWPTYARNESRNGMTSENIAPPLSLAWSNDVTGGIGNGSPVVVDSLLIIGTLRGELYVFDVRTGKRLGWLAFGDAIQGSPVVQGQVVFVAVSNSSESLVAYNMSAGKRLWARPYGDIEVSPVLSNERLYFGNTDGDFFSVSADDGEEMWRFSVRKNTKMKGIRSSAALADSTVVFGCEDGLVYGLDRETGEQRWTLDTKHPVVASPCIVDGVAFVGNMDGRMFAVETGTGTQRWAVDLGSPIFAGAALSGQTILAVTTDGKLSALNRHDGARVWLTDLGSVVNASPVVAGSYVYVGTLRKVLYGVRAESGEIVLQETVDGRIKTAPAVGFGRLFVATDERWVLAFQEGRVE